MRNPYEIFDNAGYFHWWSIIGVTWYSGLIFPRSGTIGL